MISSLFKVSPYGVPLIIFFGTLGWLLALFGFIKVSVIFFIFSLALVFFFRDPDREILESQNGVLAPADGKIVEIKNIIEPNFIEEERLRISIFLSILDCHVNRFPVSGKVLATKYIPGRYELAFKEEASENNEKLTTYIELDSGLKIVLVQITGFLARRIVSEATIGNYFEQGKRFGIIKFGSRVDIYLPLETQLNINIGDKVKAGETILAWLKEEKE